MLLLALGAACAVQSPPPAAVAPADLLPRVPPEVAAGNALAERMEALCEAAESPDLSEEQSAGLVRDMAALLGEYLEAPPPVQANPRLQGAVVRMNDAAFQIELDANAAPESPAVVEESPKDTLLTEATFLAPADLGATYAQVEAALRQVSVGLDIPADDPTVLAYVNLYQGKLRTWFSRALARGYPVVPRMQQIFRDEGVPPSLVYLAIVESAFNPGAVSRAKAVGMWQFIAGTGKRYGLQIDFWEDQRRDPELSARASARYLKDLYALFGDWPLALASYNCGEARILRYKAKNPKGDFWTLRKTRTLRRETREYVPAIFAAILIASNPSAYGFEALPADPPEPTASVILAEATDLRVLARCAQIPIEQIQALNPSLKRLVTPPREYALKIPAHTYGPFQEAFAVVPTEERLAVAMHTVSRGETLASLARRYKTSAEAIRLANLMKGRRIAPGQTLVVPLGVPASDPSLYVESRGTVPKGAKVYKVRRGDTLAAISRQTGIPVARLKELNGLESDALRAGQRLVLAEKSESSGLAARPSSAGAPESPKGRVHHVRSGDTLWDLARKYGTTVDKICRANRISPGKRLHLGDTLVIP
ncbi:MAG: LysM peptidoglycan-binding domain-containing protein [Acidobacteriota bacterium]